MKKLLLLLFLIPVFAAAQKTTGGNYTYIAQRYEDFTRLFQALNIPAGDSAQHKSGQDMRAGALYYDTLGIDAGLKIWNGLAWVDIGTGGFFSPDQTSTGNTAHEAGGFNFALNNVGDLSLNSENTNLIANSDFTISGDSVRMNSTSGRITFPNLVADDDTTTFKPMGRDAATGRLRQLSYWPGGGGSSGTNNTNVGAFYRWLKPTPQEIKSFAPGYGILIDSTTNTDALTATADTASVDGLASKDYVTDRISEIGVGNLAIIRAGEVSGSIQQHFIRNDSLFLEDIKGSTFINVTKTTDSTSNVALDTASAGLKSYIALYGGGGGGGGANTALSNLAAVAVNTSLISDADNTDDLGSSAISWKDVYARTIKLDGSTSGTMTLQPAAAAGSGTLTFPATTGTIATLNLAQTFTGSNTFSAATELTGGFRTNTTSVTSNWSVPSSASASSLGTSQLLFGPDATVYARVISRGSTNALIGAGASYSGVIIGDQGVTEAASGTHDRMNGFTVKGSTITNGAASTNYLTTAYIEGPMTGITPAIGNYAFWVDAGTNRFDGLFNSGGTDLTANQIWGANAAGTAMEGKTLVAGTNMTITHGANSITFDAAGGSGVTTMGAIGSTPNANGATITGSTLNLEPASATFGGIVTTGTQSFAGTKSFGLISATGISTSGYYGAAETGSISTPGSGIGFFWAKTDGTPNYTNDDGLAVTLVGKKTNSEASTATPTPTGDAFQNIYNLTALATNATFAAPSGTPVDGNIIWMTIKDDGTSRTLGWNAIYDEGSDVALPTATVAGEEMELQLRYRGTTSKWRIIGKTGGF